MHRYSVPFLPLLLVSCLGYMLDAQSPVLETQPDIPKPVLTHRLPAAQTAAAQVPRFDIDVVVDDAKGNAVTGLQPWDFRFTDNRKPSKILFFRSYDGVTVKPAPPVEVILLIDEINLPFTQVSFVKQELARFLGQNDGHLAQPVSLILLTDKGLRVQPLPTQDGHALLGTLHRIHGDIRTIDSAMGSEGAIDRFQRSVRQMEAIALNEARKPGRKLLVWIGPGWPLLDTLHFAPPSDTDKKRYFRAIVDQTNWLRKARIVVYSVSGGRPEVDRAFVYKSFLGGISNWHDAAAGNLALKVLVTQTGGLILGPDNDLAGQINRCVADANTFYQIAFTPAPAQHPDEYHELKLDVDQPGLTVRTNSAYYDELPTNSR